MSDVITTSPKQLRLKYDLRNDNYLDFIEKLREEARDKDKLSHGRPVLPLESDADPPYVDVNLLENGIDKASLRIRRHDLRLINYHDPFGNLIDVDDFKLYDDDSRLVDLGIEGLLLGFNTFMEAVDVLVNSCDKLNECQRENNLRTSLAVLCLVLCEGTKLSLFSRMLGSAFKSEFQVPLSPWLLQRINDWGHFSKELSVANVHADADCDFYLPNQTNDWHAGRRVIGVTCQAVAKCLGILRAFPPPPEPMVEEYLTGLCLIEVYTVSVYLNGGRSGCVYGTIVVDDGYGRFTIYERDCVECESIESHGTLTLQDPNGFITARWKIEMELDLMDGSDKSEISKGKLRWDTALRDESYDCRLSCMVRGKNGYAIVYYTVFDNAIQAEVETSLVPKEGHPYTSDDISVCGRLSARYGELVYASDIHLKYYQTTLFDKPVSKEQSAWFKLGEVIKLSRSRVTVPVDDSLILVADLKSCEGKPVVTGSMEWHPKELGDFEGIMRGNPNDSHLLRVKVKWREIVFTSKSK